MTRNTIMAVTLGALALACGGSQGGSDAVEATLPVMSQGVTTIPQGLPAEDGGSEVLPGQANVWDLRADLSLAGGGAGQVAGALSLAVTTLPAGPLTVGGVAAAVAEAPAFAAVGEGELTFYGPGFARDDVAGVVSDGASVGMAPLLSGQSVFLSGTETRLSQVVDLANGVAPIWVSWLETVRPGTRADGPGTWRLVVRDPAGAELATLLETTQETRGAYRAFELSRFAGQRVAVSLELRGGDLGVAEIDAVSIVDAAGHCWASDDFEGGLGGWAIAAGATSQDVGTPAQAVGQLAVTRTFYTAPRATWGRWVDAFENAGATPVTADVVYPVTLGAGSAGVAVDAGAGALAVADASGRVRDVGLVFGDGTVVRQDGDGRAFVVHRVVVPAGGTVSLVHFVVLPPSRSTTDDILAGRSVAASAAAGIARGFRRDASLKAFLTRSEVSRIANL